MKPLAPEHDEQERQMAITAGIDAKFAQRVAFAASLTFLATAAMAQSLGGTATYRERMTLPPAAVFEAVLEDTSNADAAPQAIARTRVVSPGNPPIAFTIPYERSRIRPERRYAIRAQILVDEKVLFTTDQPVPVLTQGSPAKVTLLLRRVSAGTTTSAPAGERASAGPVSAVALEGTTWQLVNFQGGDDKTLAPDDRAKYTLAFGAGGALTARIDCNRGRGTWASSGPNQLRLGPLALTRAACPAGSLHDQVVKHLDAIRSFVLKDGRLYLALMADGGIYEFEPFGKR